MQRNSLTWRIDGMCRDRPIGSLRVPMRVTEVFLKDAVAGLFLESGRRKSK
jgi:hypothetical protein